MLRLLLVLVAFVVPASLAEPEQPPRPEEWIAAWGALTDDLKHAGANVDFDIAELTPERDTGNATPKTEEWLVSVLESHQEEIHRIQLLAESGTAMPLADQSLDRSAILMRQIEWYGAIRQSARILSADAHRHWTIGESEETARRLSAILSMASASTMSKDDVYVLTGIAVADQVMNSIEVFCSAETETPFDVEAAHLLLDEVKRWEGEPFVRGEKIFRKIGNENPDQQLIGDPAKQDEAVQQWRDQITHVKELLQNTIDAGD